ncbi:MAG: AI-2E family transporter, partial [Lachnospiraceae bacterium]|nr:AI-2E family transporter [Lachnospiraceae bacterium]
GSVGLPAVFTLIAVFVGGNLFGILGMLFFIPLTSVIYQLVGENVRSKKQKKCK